MLDRSIPEITPFFKKKQSQLHHLQRYKTETEITAIFYNADNLTNEDKAQGEAYITAMGLNFYSKHNDVLFIDGMNFCEVTI